MIGASLLWLFLGGGFLYGGAAVIDTVVVDVLLFWKRFFQVFCIYYLEIGKTQRGFVKG